MNENGLLKLVESVLGTGKRRSNNNYAFFCPKCNHRKQKLEVNLQTNSKGENPYHCWTCDFKGKTIYSLFTALKVVPTKFETLSMLVVPTREFTPKLKNVLKLPEEYITLSQAPKTRFENIKYSHALAFLNGRNLNHDDILKYNLGFCTEGTYQDRIIIPSYDGNGDLNYFSARSFTDSKLSYLNPPVERDIIGFEYFINWEVPIILVEGPMDAMTVKRNIIPLFGKDILPKLMSKIVSSDVSKIYIALDKDALKKSIKYCQELMRYGKEVYFVEMTDKDFSKMGFVESIKLLENTYPMTFEKLINIKLNK